MNNSKTRLAPLVPLVQGTNSTNGTNKYRYTLDKSSKKHLCPNCNKKSFVFYFDNDKSEFLPSQYGRCDRESKCSYHLNPYLDGYAKGISEKDKGNYSEFSNGWQQRKNSSPQAESKPVFFDFETFKQTLQADRYEKNIFIQNLFNTVQFPFEVDEVTQVLQLYRLGTVANGYRAGAITFPYIDIKNNVRAIQVKQFNEQNHSTGTPIPLNKIIEGYHRKNKKPLPEWLEAYNKNESTFSCLFGEHLLNRYPTNPIALVEAPKTAVYGTLYFGLPNTNESLIWLAVYNKSSFSFDKLKVLQGRLVFVFPDLSKDGKTFTEWQNKALEYESRLPGVRFIFSDLLELKAAENDKNKGNDLADYLIKQDWRKFRKRHVKEHPPQPEIIENNVQNIKTISHVAPIPKVEVFRTEPSPTIEQTQNWSNDLAELETYFASIQLPSQPIRINNFSEIVDCNHFIQSHISTLNANNGKRNYLPYLDRLQELKNILTTKTH